jgi:hypothetical protein
MRALKVLVIVLGVMIVAAAGLLVYGIVNKLGDLAVADRGVSRSFGERMIELPPGAEVKTFAVEEGRLVIHLILAEAGERLLILDLETGQQLGTIMLQKGTAE